MIKDTWDYVSSRFWPVALGAAAMGIAWLSYAPPSNVIASSPDRIIPSAIEKTMADGSLNTDLFEVRICNVDSKNYLDETMFVVYRNEEDKERDENGVMLLASLGPKGSLVFTSYEGEKWRCGRPRF